MSEEIILLQHFYHGKLVSGGRTSGGFMVTAHSEGLTVDAATEIYKAGNLGSYSGFGLDELTYGVGLVRANDAAFLALHIYPARHRDRGHAYADFHGVIVPAEIVDRLQGRVTGWLDGVFRADRAEQPTFPELMGGLPPLELPLPPPPTREQEIAALQDLYSMLGHLEGIEPLLAALLSGRAVACPDAPPTTEDDPARVRLVEGLACLLPPSARPYFTFATEVFDGQRFSGVRLKLLFNSRYVQAAPEDIRWSWADGALRDAPARHPYAGQVQYYWSGGTPELPALVDYIRREIEWRCAPNITSHDQTPQALAIAARSARLAGEVAAGRAHAADLFETLLMDRSLPDDLRRRYRQELLRCVDRGQGEYLLNRLLESGLAPAALDEWADTIREAFRRTVGLLEHTPGKLAGLIRRITLPESRPPAIMLESLVGARSFESWVTLSEAYSQIGVALALLYLDSGPAENALRLLAALNLEGDGIDELALADLAAQVYALVRDLEWRDSLANEGLGNLWAAHALSLSEEEYLYLLGTAPSRQSQDRLLRRLFEEVLEGRDRRAQMGLLRRAADILDPPPPPPEDAGM
jgi:hypothetical protein